MASEDIVIRFIIEDKRFKKGVDQSTKKLSFMEKQAKATNRAMASFIGNIAATAVTRAFNGIINLTSSVITNMIEFEAALVGVGKTTNLTGSQLRGLGDEIQALAKELPVPTNELLQLTQNAAQLGIRGTEALIKFTETAAKLGITTDLSASQASISLAKLLNLTSESATSVDRLGSVFVELGNNFATTESAILTVSTEVARATTQFNLTSAEIAGISTALSALGIQSEVAGTSIGRTFRRIEEAISGQGAKFRVLQTIIGDSGETIEEEFGEKPIVVFEKFIKGLSRISDEGGNVNAALKSVGLANDRLLKVLPPLIKRNDLLTAALASARKEYEANNALNVEASAVTSTLKSDLAELGNTWDDFTENILQEFTPAMKAAVAGIKGFIDAITPGDTIRSTEKEIAAVTEELEKLQKVSRDTRVVVATGGIRTAGERVAALTTMLEELEATKFEIQFSLTTDKAEENLINLNKSAKFFELERIKASNRGDADEVDRFELLRRKKQDIINGLVADEAIAAKKKQNTLELGAVNELANKSGLAISLNELEIAQRVANKEISKDKLKEVRAEVAEELDIRRNLLIALSLDQTKSLDQRKAAAKQLNSLRINESNKVLGTVKKDKEKEEAIIDSSLNTIGGLINSSRRDEFEIGKAASIAQATISGHEAVAKAFGVSGPAGFVLGPLVFAAVAAQIRGIASTQFKGGSFQQGGIVGGNSFSGDNVVANVNSAEMILNREQQTRLFDMANGAQGGGGGDTVVNTVVEIDGEAIGKAVSRQVADGLKLGENI